MESVVVQDSKQEAPVIHVEDLTVFRSGKSVIHDVNLKVFKGDFVAIVGPNGGGKSTLLLSILGLLRVQKGSIRIFDQPHHQNTCSVKLAGFHKLRLIFQKM